MNENEQAGAPPDPAPDESSDLPAVERRLSELQRRKRTTVRWHMSRDTAERAIAAIAGTVAPPHVGGGKSRRRKRHKRLL
jgi:hypothetical protein